jgi:AraC-like DNA-binding protein
MSYQQTPPPGSLSTIIDALWRTSPGGPSLILPDACTDLLFFPARRQILLAGVMTKALPVAASSEEVFGVRFHPWVAGSLLGVRADLLQDQNIELSQINERLARSLRRVRSADDFFDAVCSQANTVRSDERVSTTITAIFEDPSIDVSQHASWCGVSPRQLQRLFLSGVGLTPKYVSRIARLQRAKRLSREETQLSSLALEAGFYDQAHLCHETLSLTGCTASQIFSRIR